MCARQQADFRRQRTDYIKAAAVRANLFFSDQSADFSFDKLVQHLFHLFDGLIVCFLLFILCQYCIFHRFNGSFTRMLFLHLNR
ncbi:Uncharacterised protein [Mycobacteroides abscessus subsp. abscessus]|nr:Uncharacterised protein [Mycobacteroides abscessus subsp. abscessus]